MNISNEQRESIRRATKEIREEHSAAHAGLSFMYGAFDLMTYDELREWRRRLDAAYKKRFDELKQIELSK